MSEFKGTKGKWEVTRESLCRVSIIDSKIDVWSFQDEGISSVEEMKANAKLISKAPEMLEMLKDIVDTLESGETPHLYKIDELIKEATTI